jgi:hypothetical protein
MPEMDGVDLSAFWPAYPMLVVKDACIDINGSHQFQIYLKRIFQARPS